MRNFFKARCVLTEINLTKMHAVISFTDLFAQTWCKNVENGKCYQNKKTMPLSIFVSEEKLIIIH